MNTFDSIETFDPNDHRIDGYSKPLEPGRKIGQFQNFTLVRSLGRGGMGQVWLAEEELGGGRKRNVVCKLLPMPVQDDKKSMDDLAKTFDLTSRLFHPHICPLFGMNEDPEYGFFFVMDHCEGGSLWDWFQKPENRNGIALSELLPIFRPIAEALDYAHSQHIIHRDVKPQNIMFAIRDGQRVPCLIDFGIAARVHATMTMTMPTSQASTGTPHYMPPEQFMGEKKQDGRADQYSLAASLYHLLAGNPPFEGNIYSLAAQVMQKIPDPIPTLTAAQNSALLRALAKKPDDRFAACAEFVNSLSGTSVPASQPVHQPKPAPVASNPFADILKTAEKELAEKKKRLEVSVQKAYADENFPLAKKHVDELLALDPQNSHYLEFRGFIQRQLDEEQAKRKNAGARMVKTVNGIEYAFRWCPAGTFTMGSPKSEWDAAGIDWKSYDETQHSVTLTRGFWMLETEVTQAMWQSVMGNNPSEFKSPTRPVECVSWDDCQEFCRKLSSKLNEEVSLPTEAQWEYACRAGSETALPNGPIEILGLNNAPALDPIAWYGGNSSVGFELSNGYDSSGWSEKQYSGSRSGTHPVGKKKPNAWGLYDMIGNVWEWCQDRYDEDYYTESPTSDPCNEDSGSYRVYRGGSWFNGAQGCRSANRRRDTPDVRFGNLGFRPVLASPVPEE